MAKKTTKRPAASRSSSGSGGGRTRSGDYQLVIVESPAKSKTIGKYLGPGYVVEASIGHIRDLPSKSPKGSKQPVPGVDIDHDFTPTYEIDDDKKKTVAELRRLAKGASEIWFATDLDREGEAIAWHLTQVLDVDPARAKRVTFDAITKSEIQRAFQSPRAINMPRVEAQQARRIVDRIVGYQVSPILWKKVAGGLSAGRVQSVATRIVVDREQEIRAFTPDESWEISASLTFDVRRAAALVEEWSTFMAQRDDRGRQPLVRDRMAWLADRRGLACDLVEVGGRPVRIGADNTSAADLTMTAQAAAEAAGLVDVTIDREHDAAGRGRGKNLVRISGRPDPAARYRVESIDVTRTRSKPFPPFITSTLQQAASSRLGMSTDRTMRIAQQLYEGIDLPDEGRVGLITYMRTDSTNLSREAIEMARGYLDRRFGAKYLPEKPRVYTSSNESAQEAHEAIRPTDVSREPDRIAAALLSNTRDGVDQLKVYRLIWQSFVACQATDAEWDSTAVRMRRSDRDTGAVLKANGRVLRFDGFYAVSGTPRDDGDQVLPAFEKGTELAPFDIEPRQKFQAPPPRYTEATLVKKMEEEGIGRPSTYASIINVIENRNYVVQQDRRFHATAIGEAVTGFLKRGFQDQFIEIGYTREIERELDQVAQGKKRWTDMLHEFHDELSPKLETAMQQEHEKAKADPSPYACPQCGRRLEYRLGGKGEFLSCSGYNEKVLETPAPVAATTTKGKRTRKPAKPKEVPACTFAMPVDRQRRPLLPEQIDLLSPAGVPMVKRTGRFGDFLVEDKPRPVKPRGKKAQEAAAAEPPPFILNLDKKGNIKFPSPPPLVTDIECPKCGNLMNLRDGKRGPWLGCRAFPKCRGREAFTKLPEPRQKELTKELEAHMRGHTKLVLTRRDGTKPVEDGTPLSTLTMEGGVAELKPFEA